MNYQQTYNIHAISHWADPIYKGDYPPEMKERISKE